MNLTKYDKTAFVRAVMADVPKEDYDQLAKEAVLAHINGKLPAALRCCMKDYPEHFSTSYLYLPGSLCNVAMLGSHGRAGLEEDEALWAKLTDLSSLKAEQVLRREELEAQLTAAISSCRTLKQAKERLPEFEAYLPAERDGTGTSNLPAISNLVAGLTQAGWKCRKAA